MGLFAFALKRRIGVDVESASRRVAGDRIAERFLAESEASGLRSVSKPHRHCAFLRYWTHKEAYLKATGEGISSGSLSRFEVSVDPQLPARLERVDGAPDEAGRWRLEDLPLDGSTFVGAVCVEGQDWRLRCLQFVQS
jgi:4'-phosphopantetheinyl transferase